jgi:hypothetical protein
MFHVEFAPLDTTTVEETIQKYQAALQIKQSPDLRNEAVAKIVDKDLEDVKAMPAAQTLRETLNERVNGRANTN